VEISVVANTHPAQRELRLLRSCESPKAIPKKANSLEEEMESEPWITNLSIM
jgi:hypothetical protein